jgi:hypothetical protein
MKNLKTFQSTPRPGWQILGELELLVEVSVDTAIYPWMIELLHSLPLHAGFVEKLSTSAQEAARRVLQEPHLSDQGHIHVVVFTPTDIHTQEGTWGFFRIEKFENGLRKNPPDHTIEFYLYLE